MNNKKSGLRQKSRGSGKNRPKMGKNHKNHSNGRDGQEIDGRPEVNEENVEGAAPEVEEVVPEDMVDPDDEVDPDVEKEVVEKKEYLFLMAEFDNFRKRTLKEKSELVRNAGEQVLKGLLPIVDDFERGLKSMESVEDVSAVKEGMVLIYNKLRKYLEQNGVKEFDPEDKDFDADRHEAISAVPVPDESLKGKILDTVEKGYMLNDKVLRHAKVVVGQ